MTAPSTGTGIKVCPIAALIPTIADSAQASCPSSKNSAIVISPDIYRFPRVATAKPALTMAPAKGAERLAKLVKA
jgi:hypothetical protein